ncbi:unnamed protein product [Effrenium voratum]|nr:unnamed protein product [Effrenium voratum]
MAFRDLPALLKWSSKVRTWKPLKPRSKPSISAELPKGQGRLRVAASHSSDRLRPDAELLQEGFLPGAMSSPSRWQDSKLPQATERGEDRVPTPSTGRSGALSQASRPETPLAPYPHRLSAISYFSDGHRQGHVLRPRPYPLDLEV